MTTEIRVRRFSSIVAFLCAALLTGWALAPPRAFAQSGTASVSGRVTDQSGAVAPGAEVEIIEVDTGIAQVTKTNGVGLYVFPSLAPGRYLMNVRMQGFRTVSVTSITLNVQDNLSRNFVLQVGSSAESVTVTASAVNVNTTDASVGTVVDRNFVANMPLNGRSLQSLIELTPGVVAATGDYNNQGQFSVNGQRTDSNYFTVDGVSANAGVGPGGAINTAGGGGLPATSANGGFNNLVSIDAIQEFKIETSTFAPEYGRAPGAQVAIVTRSGANSFHGDAFDYLRNNVFDANDWFLNQNKRPIPPLRQNDFGAVFGGPIVKDKLFFFFSYEGLRLTRSPAQNAIVPTPLARTTASAYLRPFLDSYSLPNCAATSCPAGALVEPFVGPAPSTSNLDATSIRVDYHPNSRQTFFGRYDYAPSSISTQTISNQIAVNQVLQTATLGYTLTVTQAMVNDFRLNYTHSPSALTYRLVSFAGGVPVPDSAAFPLSSFTRANAEMFIVPGPGIPFLGDGRGPNNSSHQWNVVDTVTLVRGSHQLKMGFDYRQLTPAYHGDGFEMTLNYNTFANWSNSTIDELDIGNEPGEVYRINNYSAFAQDTWVVNPRLTLTYGLRWDVNPGITSPNGTSPFALNQFDASNPTAATLAPFGTPTWETTWTDVAPRIGAAYQLSRDASWGRVLRVGFGIFYDTGAGAAGFTFGPYANSKALTNEPTPPPASDLTPLPISLKPPFFGHAETTDPHLLMPRVYDFSAALEQALGANQSVSVTYVGNVGQNLLRTEAFFPFVPNAVFPAGYQLFRSTASSDYDALQLQYQRRLSHGLQALASYSWSHSIDDASTPVGNTSHEIIYHIGGYTSSDRGSSDFDIRHSFQTAISYAIPSPERDSFTKALFGNWGLDTLFRYRSAMPLNIFAGTYRYHSGGSSTSITLRPDAVAGQPFYLRGGPGDTEINPLAFTGPPIDPATGNPIRDGDLGRNALRAFGAHEVDLALRREFPLLERLRLEFRADFFNLFNHPSFAPQNNLLGFAVKPPVAPGTTFTTTQSLPPNFGRSTSMLANSIGSGNGANGGSGGLNPLYQFGGPRSIQLSLKLVF